MEDDRPRFLHFFIRRLPRPSAEKYVKSTPSHLEHVAVEQYRRYASYLGPNTNMNS